MHVPQGRAAFGSECDFQVLTDVREGLQPPSAFSVRLLIRELQHKMQQIRGRSDERRLQDSKDRHEHSA